MIYIVHGKTPGKTPSHSKTPKLKLQCIEKGSTIVGVPGDKDNCTTNVTTLNDNVCDLLSTSNTGGWFTTLDTNWVCSGEGNKDGLYPNNSCSITFDSNYTKEKLTNIFTDMCLEHNANEDDDKYPWYCNSIRVTNLGKKKWRAELGSGISDFQLKENSAEMSCSTATRIKNANLDSKITLKNSLSSPSYLGSPIFFNGIYTNTAKQEMLGLDKNGNRKESNYDFSPFKIVPLQYLIDNNKVHIQSYEDYVGGCSCEVGSCDSGPLKIYDFCMMNFSRYDEYLPVGDAIFVAPTKVSDMYILLVKNDSKYSSIVADNDWKYIGSNTKCYSSNVGRLLWSVSSSINNDRIYNRDYYIVGDCVFNTWLDTGGNGNRPIAAVHKDYLEPDNSYGLHSSIILNLQDNWGDECGDCCFCKHINIFSASSTYNTFNIWGGLNPNSNPNYLYFNIKPSAIKRN